MESRGAGAGDPAGGAAGPERGTCVAVGYALLAVGLVGSWGLAVGRNDSLTPVVFACLLATAYLAERIALPLSPRGWYTVSTPVVVLTGLLGGPTAGALAGVATALGDDQAAWRRRLTFGGLDAVRGFAAGLAGMLPVEGAVGAALRSSLAVGVALGLNGAGRLLIHHVRRIGAETAFHRGTLADTLEAVAAVPVLALLVQSFEESGPALVLLALAGLLVALWLSAAAVRRGRARLEAERLLARTDPLTGALNRRGLEEELARQHARVVRGERPAGLIVLDVDRFKQVNTEHGWDAGDAVLRGLVQRLAEATRETDVVARRGGEEFALVLPGTDSADALLRAAEKARLAVRAAPFDAGSVAIPVTISLGAALLDGRVEPAVVERRANVALAEAKEQRDRSVVEPLGERVAPAGALVYS